MRLNRFCLTSDDCELLLELETCGTIEKTALALAKDPSGVSRQLSNIAAKYPAVEKRGGRWQLTEIGKKLNSLSRDAIQIQRKLSEQQSALRIGMTREFGARVVGPQLPALAALFPGTQLMLSTFESGIEAALLGGKIDFGFDCDRPVDPGISYKHQATETIVVVAAKAFKKRFGALIAEGKLYQTPHLLCERLFPDKHFADQENKLNIFATFNDIAAARSACVAGAGWALLPKYAVQDELDAGTLVVLTDKKIAQAKYGVWWPRSRHLSKDTIQKAGDWLRAQKL